MDKLVEYIDSLDAQLGKNGSISQKQAAIETEAMKNPNGMMTADQQAAYDAFDKEHAEKETERANAKKQLDQQRARQARTATALNTQRKTSSTDANTNTDTRVGNARLAADEDPKHGFKDHKEFLTCVMSASQTGQVDERLRSLVSPGSGRNATAGSDEQGTYSDPYGGFFVPVSFSPETLRLDPESNPMAGLVRGVPMETPSISFNARVDKDHSSSVSGGLRVYRRKETQTVAASRMEHEQVTLNATGLFGVAYATEELLARSLVSFVTLLGAGFSDEFNAKLVNERLNGTGVGEFEGILNSACKISVSAESGQPAATIVKENIDQMRMRCWRYGSAVWLANHGTLAMLRSLVQVIGTGGIAVPYLTVSPDGQAMLDGRPLYFTEFCPALGTTGDLILCNWSEYLEGTLTSMSNAESMHVRFLEHERTFKFWTENDARCWWRSALTPKNGPTRSPFVVLATR
jgi:HK97 family phage major capsid protein